MTHPEGPRTGPTPDELLERGFAALRDAPPPLPDGLEQRLLAHALRAMPPEMVHKGAPRRAGLARIAAQLGGWWTGLVLGGAAMAGLSLGFLDPGGLISVESGLFAALDAQAPAGETAFDDPFDAFEAELGS